MARVVALVLNEVSRDARVCRAAAALQEAGHDVHVVGVHGTGGLADHERVADGFEVHRVGAAKRARANNKATGNAQPMQPLTVPDELPIRPATGAAHGAVPRPLFALRHSGRPFTMLKADVAARLRDRKLARTIVGLRPDIVHAHDVNSLPAAASAARATGAHLVFDAHEVYDQVRVAKPTDEAKRRRSSHLIARFAPAMSGFITLTDAIADYYEAHYAGLPKATIVANAAPKLAPVIYDGRLHAAAGFPRSQRILLYQGGYASVRCLAELVDAAELLNADWGIVTVGFGDDRAALEARVATLGPSAQARVKVLDAVPQSELPAWTAGAELGYIAFPKTHLNHWLASPNRLWSYPQAGVPILGTPFVELQRVHERYGAAFLIQDKLDGAAIAAAVNGISDAALTEARLGCARFMQAEGWETNAQRLIELFDRLGEASA